MAEAVVGRGLVEILPDFRKWGKQLATDMKLAKTQLDGSTAGLKAAAATTVTSMAKVGKGVTLVGAGVAIASIKMAGDFQAQTAVLQTAAGETTSGLKTVREGILNISKGTGTGIKNLTDGMYTIEKAGFRGSDGLKVLKAAAQGAREENAKLSDVTNAMTSIMASYHLKATDSVRVMNGMKTAAGEGKITMEEFSGAMSTVLPIASANKISFEQVAGAVATLTQHGTSAREATHELGATIRALASPNNVASREMARFGLSATDVSLNLGKRGLTGTIDLLTSTILGKMGPSGKVLMSAFEGTKQSAEDARIMMSKMPSSLQKLAKEFLGGKISVQEWRQTLRGLPVDQANLLSHFASLVNKSKGFSRELKSGGPAAKTYTDALKKMSGGAIGLNTILQLSGESADGFKERVKKVGESFHNGSKDVEGWKTTQKLLNVQLDRAKQSVKVLMIEIGTKLIPVVSGIIQLMTRHKDVVLALIIAFAALLGALSAVYVGTKIYSGVLLIVTASQTAWAIATLAQTDSLMVMRAQLILLAIAQKASAVAQGIVTAATWAWSVALNSTGIPLLIIGIAALIAIIVIIATKTTWFQTAWKATWKAVGIAIHAVWNWIKSNWPYIAGFLLGPVALAAAAIYKNWDSITSIFKATLQWLKDNWQLVVFTILTGGIGLAAAMIVRHWKGVKGAFSATLDWLKKYWPYIAGLLLGPIALAVAAIWMNWSSITKAFVWVFNKIVDLAVSFGKTLGSFFSKLPGQIGGFFSSLPGTVGHWFVVAGKAIGSFFSALPGQIQTYVNRFNSLLYNAGRDLISGLFHGVSSMVKNIPKVVQAIYDGIVSFFKAVFGIHSPSTVMAVFGVDLIRGLFAGMLRAASALTTWLADHIGRPIIHLFVSVIPNAARTFASRVSQYWGSMRDYLNRAWSSVRANSIDPIIHFFTVSIPNAGRRMRDAVNSAFRSMVMFILNRFGDVLHGASKMFGWVPGVGGKLRRASQEFDKFRDRVNNALKGVKDHNASMFVTFKGKSIAAVSAGRMATGGRVDGPGSETSDSIPAMLSKGEHVLSAREVKGMGGHEAVEGIRKTARGFAQGGAVGVRAHTPSAKAINDAASRFFNRFVTSSHSALYATMMKMISMATAAPSFGALPGGGVGKSAASAMAYARRLLAAHIYGWGMGQWPAWRNIGMGESGWNYRAYNAASGATGIPQALPGSKMRSAGADWRTNAFTQVRWMASYIHSRYGTPSHAWSLWQSRRPHWYDKGGYLPPGLSLAMNGTGRPERVLGPGQSGGITVNITINGNLLGNRHELENEFVEIMDQLRRKGRLR